MYFLVYFTIYERNYKGIKISFNSIFIIHFFTYLLTVIINPGIPNRKYYYNNYIKNFKIEDKSKYDICEDCNIITPKELKVSHCYYCDVCVVNQDHHCTCLGKCIAKNNTIIFYFWIFSIPLYALMNFVTLIAYVIYIDEENRQIRKLGRIKY